MNLEVPLDHMPSIACQYAISCLEDDTLVQKIVASVNTEVFSEGSLLQLLSFNDWVRVVASFAKSQEEPQNFISKLLASLSTLSKAHNSDLMKFV